MSNYNDGKWHGWNGSMHAPVHSRTTVKAVTESGEVFSGAAGALPGGIWDQGGVIAFRVIKEHREPREFWISKHNIFYVLPHKPESNDPAEFIHVREVTEQ